MCHNYLFSLALSMYLLENFVVESNSRETTSATFANERACVLQSAEPACFEPADLDITLPCKTWSPTLATGVTACLPIS